jgi:hypothetical protein
MSTSRPFSYNTGAPIAGTVQVGSLAVGTPTTGFTPTGLEWWNGPNEDLGFVIAQSVPGDTQPTPVPGVSASVGFFRSSALTEPSFISLANVIAGPSGPFASGPAAKTWLNANGYWTSYGEFSSSITIATNAAGGLDGFNVGGQAIAFTILANPAIGTTYPIGSTIVFQNGEARTFVGYDDYGSTYDMFYDSPISTGTLFPITIGVY